jgi:uncharacterized spore protein YtfJ
MTTTDVASVLSRLDAVKDTMSVRRAFADPYQIDGVSIIPVAKVGGGGGGGGGEGGRPDEPSTGTGAGMGFGVNVRPIGVFAVKDGEVTWRPAIDAMRVILGGQLLLLAGILTVRRVLLHRRR